MDSLEIKSALKHKFIWVLLFSIAMGFLEGAVVVYIRELYYPSGFNFPLIPIPDRIAFTELIREISTVIMLASIGMLCGKSRHAKWAWFMFAFGIWDIVYYIALKIILNWPANLFTWDVLFLIPVPWIGPVIAPCLISVLMIILSLVILQKEANGFPLNFPFRVSFFLLIGCTMILYSFMEDYFRVILDKGLLSALWFPGSKSKLFEVIATYVPDKFDWTIFIAGVICIIYGIVYFSRKGQLPI